MPVFVPLPKSSDIGEPRGILSARNRTIPPKFNFQMRRFLMITHRWIAIAVSVFLLLTAASGAALIFEGAIDRGLHPALWRVTSQGAPLAIDSLVARVEAALPGHGVNSVNVSHEPEQAWTLGVGAVTAFVNPYTGSITGTRSAAESQTTLARRLHVFHVEFFAGRLGRSLVGVLSGIALYLIISGMILWWPDKLVRINTSASWKRINFDLHHAFGIFTSLVLIVITASGLVIHYDGLAMAIKSLDSKPPFSPPSQPAPPPSSADAPSLRPSFDVAANAALKALPGAEIMFLSLGNGPAPATVSMRFPDDHTPGGRSRVFVDRVSGRVLAVSSSHDAEIGTRMDNLKRSLHTGDVFGKTSSLIWLVATLAMIVQIVTGILMWWNARRGRRRARAN